MWSLLALVFGLVVVVTQSFPYRRQGGSILYGPVPKSFHEGNRRGQDGRYIYVYDGGYARGERTFHARSRSGNRGNVIYESDDNDGHHFNANSIGNLYKMRHTTTAAPTSTDATVTTDGDASSPLITDEPATPGLSPKSGNYHGNTGINFNMGGVSITGPFTANGGGNVKVIVFGPKVNGPFSFNKLVTEEKTTTDQPMISTTMAEETTLAEETTTTTKKTTTSFLVKFRKNNISIRQSYLRAIIKIHNGI